MLSVQDVAGEESHGERCAHEEGEAVALDGQHAEPEHPQAHGAPGGDGGEPARPPVPPREGMHPVGPRVARTRQHQEDRDEHVTGDGDEEEEGPPRRPPGVHQSAGRHRDPDPEEREGPGGQEGCEPGRGLSQIAPDEGRHRLEIVQGSPHRAGPEPDRQGVDPVLQDHEGGTVPEVPSAGDGPLEGGPVPQELTHPTTGLRAPPTPEPAPGRPRPDPGSPRRRMPRRPPWTP